MTGSPAPREDDRRRLTAQLLAGTPATDPVAVVRRLLAVQAQDPRGARLAIRARTTGLTAAAVDRALTDDRSLLVSWLNRGTLHLVTREDHAWLQALTTPAQLTGNARRLGQEGVPPDAAERGVAAVTRALADGPLTRDALREHVRAAGVRTEGQALVHVLFRASLRGLIVRGPMAGREQAFVLTEDWLGPLPPVDRDVALAELARRFLAGHGPATERDLAKWAGVTLGEARAGLRATGGELEERDGGLVDLAARTPAAAELAPPRLLGAFDPLLHGWVSREPVLGDRQDVVTSNGIFRPIALVDGRAVATWTMPGGVVTLAPFGRIARAAASALEADAADVQRFLAAAA